jgi:hypothetical protein
MDIDNEYFWTPVSFLDNSCVEHSLWLVHIGAAEMKDATGKNAIEIQGPVDFAWDRAPAIGELYDCSVFLTVLSPIRLSQNTYRLM